MEWEKRIICSCNRVTMMLIIETKAGNEKNSHNGDKKQLQVNGLKVIPWEKGCWNSVVIKSGIEREEVMAENAVIEAEMKKSTVAGNKTSEGLQSQCLKG